MTRLITINPETIKQLDGLYCLNDLHRLAGGHKKDTPSRFIRLDKTQALIQAFNRQYQKMGSEPHNPLMGSEQVLKVINGGDMQGVYACKPLMFAYTAWLDADFHAIVYKVFDRVTTASNEPITHTAQINQLCHELKGITQLLSFCGRNLAIHGKQTKPQMTRELNTLLEQQQPQLPLGGVNE